MRSKENAHDYRYFPEPDILQVNFTDEMLDSIKNMLPELPYKRMERYMKDYGLSKTDAQILLTRRAFLISMMRLFLLIMRRRALQTLLLWNCCAV